MNDTLMRWKSACLAFALSIPFLMVFAGVEPDPRKVMEGVYRQDSSRDATWRATLETIDKAGKSKVKQFVYRRLGAFGNSKTLVRFTDPVEVRGVGMLSMNQQGANERQWMYTPAIQRVRRIAPQEQSRRFLGTDFSNEDMAERVLDDFNYRMLVESESLDGRRAIKIEVKPVQGDRSQYGYLYVWVDQEIPLMLLAEYYDRNGQLIRVMKTGQVEKVIGIWVARRVEMKTPAAGSTTILKIASIQFNTGLKEEMFTQQALERKDEF